MIIEIEKILETMIDGHLLVDIEGRIISANSSYCKMSGYSKEELLQLTLHDIQSIYDYKKVKERIEKVNKKGFDKFESIHKRKDGSKYPVEVSIDTIFENNKYYFLGTFRDITEKKQLNEKLETSEKIFNHSLDMLCIAGFDGYFKVLNPAWEKTLGWSNEEMLEKPWIEFVYPDDIDTTNNVKSVIVDGKEIYQFENRYICKNGDVKWLSWNSFPYPDENIMFGVARDITEQKLAEINLMKSKRLLSQAEEIADMGSWEWDSENDIAYWSDGLFRIFMRSPKEGAPKLAHQSELYEIESYENLKRSVNECLKNGKPYELEMQIIRSDGEIRTCISRGRAEKNQEGKINRLWGTFNDITDQRKAEKALIESEERYKALFENSGVGIGYYSKEGIVLSYNRLALKNMGGKLEDYKGKSIRELFPKEAAEIYFTRIVKAISSDEPQEYEDYIVFNSAPKWFSSTFTRVMNATGEVLGVQIASLDITERKMAEDKLLYLSNHDQLTGLYNRRFYDLELKRLDSSKYLPLSIIVCDINGLKLINDSLGHDAGDQVIKNVAEAIEKACRIEDIIFRTGGDEFIILLPMTSAGESLEIAKHMKELASKESIENIEVSISYGSDTKKTDKQSIIEIIANAENYMYRNKLHESSSIRSKTIDLIMSALFAKSKREAAHSNRVGNICESIASKMNLDKDAINQMKIAGFIHDIGKIGIDEKILNKPGSLTIDERSEIERHPEIGWRLLSATKEFSELAQFLLSHHEKWDGSGYPNRLKGKKIPLEARIICVADSYDAMTTDRSYRKGLNKEDATKELLRCAGTQFDLNIVDVFVNQVLSGRSDFGDE